VGGTGAGGDAVAVPGGVAADRVAAGIGAASGGAHAAGVVSERPSANPGVAGQAVKRGGNGNQAGRRIGAGAAVADDNTIAVTTPVNPGNPGHGQGGVSSRANGGAAPEKELSLSFVQRPKSLAKREVIGDSALRAFNAKSALPALVHKKGVYEINRKWQFGLTIAPDFASVNSLAGDKAGSSVGLTVDYVFAPHWYLGTGILATRRNYAARNQDYHVPQGYYQQNNIYGGVNFVKGSFYMMEVPLNLRYDFSVAGNTLFFISAGSSSYFLTTENANLYWHHFNMDMCSPMDHLPIQRTNLFATINLSAGVEAGLSNSLSLLIAPYTKLPTKKLGLGQVQMNSVGINFTLKWSPVTSRGKR
jgi:hypothetical protein